MKKNGRFVLWELKGKGELQDFSSRDVANALDSYLRGGMW